MANLEKEKVNINLKELLLTKNLRQFLNINKINKMGNVYILTRNRDFNSLTQFEQAISALNGLDVDFNRMKFTYNGNDCPN